MEINPALQAVTENRWKTDHRQLFYSNEQCIIYHRSTPPIIRRAPAGRVCIDYRSYCSSIIVACGHVDIIHHLTNSVLFPSSATLSLFPFPPLSLTPLYPPVPFSSSVFSPSSRSFLPFSPSLTHPCSLCPFIWPFLFPSFAPLPSLLFLCPFRLPSVPISPFIFPFFSNLPHYL